METKAENSPEGVGELKTTAVHSLSVNGLQLLVFPFQCSNVK